MNGLDKVLSLRPTNAAQRLGAGSKLPLLNPRDLIATLAARRVPILTVPVSALEVIPGALRAARDRDAVLGLACAYPLASREGAFRFFETVRKSADDFGHVRPVFLQAGPIHVRAIDERQIQQLTSEIFRFVDAGFSLLSLDTSGVGRPDDVRICAELGQAAAERELSIEVTAPREMDGRPSARRLRSYLEELGRRGVHPQFVRLRSTLVLAESAPGADVEGDFERVRDFQEVASELGAAITIEDWGTPVALLPSWRLYGARKIDSGGWVAQRVIALHPAETSARARRDAAERQLPLAEVLGQMNSPLVRSDPDQKDRLEALAYADVSELLQRLGSVGSAKLAMQQLVQGPGY